MSKYEIEPEYKILRHLQTQTENRNVTPKEIIENAGITSAYWHSDGVKMIADGIIGRKDSPDYGLTLTNDGHKRLEYFAKLIQIEKEQDTQRQQLINVANQTEIQSKATKWLSWATLAVTFISVVVGIYQYNATEDQTDIANKQYQIDSVQLLQQIKSDSIESANPQNKTIHVKIVK